MFLSIKARWFCFSSKFISFQGPLDILQKTRPRYTDLIRNMTSLQCAFSFQCLKVFQHLMFPFARPGEFKYRLSVNSAKRDNQTRSKKAWFLRCMSVNKIHLQKGFRNAQSL